MTIDRMLVAGSCNRCIDPQKALLPALEILRLPAKTLAQPATNASSTADVGNHGFG